MLQLEILWLRLNSLSCSERVRWRQCPESFTIRRSSHNCNSVEQRARPDRGVQTDCSGASSSGFTYSQPSNSLWSSFAMAAGSSGERRGSSFVNCGSKCVRSRSLATGGRYGGVTCRASSASHSIARKYWCAFMSAIAWVKSDEQPSRSRWFYDHRTYNFSVCDT